MIRDALRLVAVILLIIIIVMDDFPFYEKMKDSVTQLFLGILVVAFIFYDTVFGFIMGLVLMLIYYEIYKKIIAKQELVHDIKPSAPIIQPGPSSFIAEGNTSDVNTPYAEVTPMGLQQQPIEPKNHSLSECQLKMDYISEAHLLAAQNNIFDVQNYQSEFKGVNEGFHSEKVYGVQGLDAEKVNHKGYSKSENIYALLSDGR